MKIHQSQNLSTRFKSLTNLLTRNHRSCWSRITTSCVSIWCPDIIFQYLIHNSNLVTLTGWLIISINISKLKFMCACINKDISLHVKLYVQPFRLTKKSYVSKLPHSFVFRCAFDSAKFKVWIFFCLLNSFFHFFMNLLVKIYKKIYDRHNETLWKTDFFNSVLSCILFIQKSSSIFQSWDRLKSDTSASQKKKTHLGQVFQSVTNFET